MNTLNYIAIGFALLASAAVGVVFGFFFSFIEFKHELDEANNAEDKK